MSNTQTYPALAPSFQAALNTGEFLSKEKEVELFSVLEDPQATPNMKKHAQDEIILAHQPLVMTSAKNFKSRTVSLEDKFQAGMVGMMDALGRFKLEKGCRFSTYAQWYINSEVHMVVFNGSSQLKTSISLFNKFLFGSYNKMANDLLKKNPNITQHEINIAVAQKWIDERNLSQNKLDAVAQQIAEYHMSREGTTASLDMPIGEEDLTLRDLLAFDDPQNNLFEEEDLTLGDLLAFDDPQNNLFEDEDMEEKIALFYEDALQHIIDNAPKKDMAQRMVDIFKARTFERPQPTLHDLAVEYDVSKERIRQIEESAKKKIRAYALKAFPSFLPTESYQSVLKSQHS